MTKFQIQQSKNCGQCGVPIFLVLNTETKKEFWMKTRPADIPKGEEWKPHFHNPAWCKDKPKQKPTTADAHADKHKTEIQKNEEDYKAHLDLQQREEAEKLTEPKQTEKVEFKNAKTRYNFERTYKVTEVTLSKGCKVNNTHMPELGEFENKDYFVNMKLAVEINSDFQQLVQEKFAEIQVAIDKEIQMDRLRLSGLAKTDDEL